MTLSCNYTGGTLNSVVWGIFKVGVLGYIVSSGSSISSNYASSYSLNTATPDVVRLTINSVSSNEYTNFYFCVDGNTGVNYNMVQISSSVSTG